VKTIIAGFVGLAAVAATASGALASHKLRQPLAPTSGRGTGIARLLLKSASEGQFEIRVRRLAADATYAVLVGGVHVADIRTTAGGQGKVRFRSRPRSPHDLPLGFDPRGATVSVRDANGDDVLGVEFADDRDADGDGMDDDGDVACCLPDDDGAECEDRTPAECVAAGGSPSGALSCLPNPCAGASPVEDEGKIVCCLPDDGGAECEDRTQDRCLSEGGTVVQANSCAPDPCRGPGTPPPADEIACCVPGGAEGAECELRTATGCAAGGGTPSPTGTCAPDPCGGSHGGGGDDGGGHGGRSGRGR
jgi:hypothetical protein